MQFSLYFPSLSGRGMAEAPAARFLKRNPHQRLFLRVPRQPSLPDATAP